MDPEALRGCQLFQTLSTAQLTEVAAIASPRELAAGAAVFKEGDAGDEMYVVMSGRIRISKMVTGVGEEALSILDAGSYFGEMAMIDDAPRSADALVHTPCKLAVIRRNELEQLMFIDKELAYNLLWTFVRTLSARLRETNDKIQGFFAMVGPFR
jgi:CRP/FNR family cyclic AMP-dependent transcriptional regulator